MSRTGLVQFRQQSIFNAFDGIAAKDESENNAAIIQFEARTHIQINATNVATNEATV